MVVKFGETVFCPSERDVVSHDVEEKVYVHSEDGGNGS